MSHFDSYVQGTPNWIELVTTDQRAGARFYADLLGWELEENPIDDQGNVYLIGRIEGDSTAGISGQMPGTEGHPPFWSVYLSVDDVDATTAKVEAAGGKVEAAPFDVMEQGRMSAIQDPTGARVNLWQPKSNPGIGRANEHGTLVWNELVTPEVDKALGFYESVVGITGEPMADLPADAPAYVVLKNVDGEDVGGACPPPTEGLPPHWNVYFNVDDTDATVARAGELGGTTVAPAFDVPGVGRMALLADPQGAMFNVMTPLPRA